MLGWRVYVTNKIKAQLSLKQAVRAYRDEYLTERGFARLKGFPLSLTPIYLQCEDHVTGLIRLLSIGLRVRVNARINKDGIFSTILITKCNNLENQGLIWP